MNLNSMKTCIVILLLGIVAVIHHVPMGGFMGTHIFHRELFFFPIVLAGLWLGPKVALENHQQCAIDAALEMRTRLSQVNLDLANRGYPPLRHGIGLHTGKVVAANIGSSQRLSYAMVGETVNVASRIQALNKDYDTDILISDAVRAGLDRCVDMSPLPPVNVKGISDPLLVHRIEPQAFICMGEV